MTWFNKKMTGSQLKSSGVILSDGEGEQRETEEGQDGAWHFSLADSGWLYTQILKPVLPSAIGRNGNKVSQNTTQAGRGGYGRDLCMWTVMYEHLHFIYECVPVLTLTCDC